MQTRKCFGVLMMSGLAVALMAGCSSTDKESFNATVSYVLEPTQDIPDGLQRVAILDAGVETKAGDGEDKDRSVKWAKISADLMESMIKDAESKFGSDLAVVKRRDTEKVLAEKDMAMAGLVQGGAAVQTAQLLDVQGLITSQLNIRVEVKKSKKSTFDITSISGHGGHGWGGGSASGRSREADAIARNVTVQCKYSLIDAATGEAVFEYAPKPFRKHDSKKPSPIFGRSSGEADLDPVDMYIGELVEKGTREFVSMFVPCEATYAYELESSRNEYSAKGVRQMRMDDYEAAMESFKLALAEEPEDHQTAFAMGVCSELMGDWDAALKYYRMAVGMPDLDDEELDMYSAAKDRVADHKDRIRKAD